MTIPQPEKTNDPNDPVGGPGMGPAVGMPIYRTHAVWNGYRYPLGHLMYLESGIEVQATKNGWVKTGKQR